MCSSDLEVPDPDGDQGAQPRRLRADGLYDEPGPLVLRARAGEWIRITLVNEVLEPDLDDDDHVQAVPVDVQAFLPEWTPPLEEARARLPAWTTANLRVSTFTTLRL